MRAFDAAFPRVLHVLPFLGMGGGAPRAALTLIAEQQKRRPTWVLSLVDDDFAVEARKTGAAVQWVYPRDGWPPNRVARWWRAVQAIRRVVKSEGIDLIHCHSAPGNRYCYPASRLTGVPLVSHQRDTYTPDHFHAWVARTDAIIAISEWVRRNLPEKLRNKVTVVHDAVAIPEEAGIVWPRESGPLVVGMAGRCVPEKGMDLLINAALALCPRMDFQIEIWGVQAGPEAEFASVLRERVRQSGYESRFRFAGYRMDMENFYRRADVVVVPSRVTEGFGLTAAEGQAWGKAVIAAGHGGLAEIVEHERTGLQFTPHDAGSLAAQLERLLTDSGLRLRLAKAGRESAAARFAPAAHAAGVDEVYRNMLGR